MRFMIALAMSALLLLGCNVVPRSMPSVVPSQDPSTEIDPVRAAAQVSCGGPGFPAALLDEPGSAELSDDPAAKVLRRHLSESGPETEWLPETGWREVVRTDTEVAYVADAEPGTDPPYAEVTVTHDGDGWQIGGWGQCRLQADVGPQLGLASFRVDPATELGPLLTEIPVLVTERACNSGENARGRIADPTILLTDAAVTVVFAVRPRDGGHDCPGNPETPHLLRLPEPLGDRSLFDGSEVPPRDATLCVEHGICSP